MVVDYLIEQHQLSKAKACRVIGLSRSAYYKPRVDWAQRDAEVVNALNESLLKIPFFQLFKFPNYFQKEFLKKYYGV